MSAAATSPRPASLARKPLAMIGAATSDIHRLGLAALSSIADGVLLVDNALRIRAMNAAASRLIGAPCHTACGKPIEAAIDMADGSGFGRIARDVAACVWNGRFPSDACISSVGTDDCSRTLEYTISPIGTGDGAIHGATLVLRDVTGRLQPLRDPCESGEDTPDLIEAGLDPILVVDPSGCIAKANSAAEKATGRSRHRLVGMRFADCFSEPAHAQHMLGRVLAGNATRDFELQIRHDAGYVTDVTCNMAPHRDSLGRVRSALVVIHDATGMQQARLQMSFQATHDALTALPNRQQFREATAQAIASFAQSDHLAAIMVVDLDSFRDINETLGHAVGDELLKQVGIRLTQTLRKCDIVARLGGDEFGVLLPDIARDADVRPVAGKLLRAMAAPFRIDEHMLTVSCCIGIATAPCDGGDALAPMRNADTALERAKESGRNCCRLFTSDMDAAVRRRVVLSNRLRDALQDNELHLHFQPQLRLDTGRIVGVEALIRWNAGDLGAVSPAEFIPVAEHTGLIDAIGAWVLHEACLQAMRWQKETGTEISVAVNLSARQFHDADIVKLVARTLGKTGLPPRLLELELTESLLMRDAEGAARTLGKLKDTGVRIAIDDFGTGYSSLAYLKRFPLDYLKIDRSFVADLTDDRNSEVIVRSTIALAHSLGLQTIAEGVETSEQMEFLRGLGCDEIQGYHISPPKAPADLLPLLEGSARRKAVPATKSACACGGALPRKRRAAC